MADATYTQEISMPDRGVWKKLKKAAARFTVYKFINGNNQLASDGTFQFNDVADNKEWKNFVKSVEPDDDRPDNKYLGKLYDVAKKVHLKDIWENTHKWNNGFKGKILFSEKENETFKLENGNFESFKNRESNAQSITSIKKLLKGM